MVLSVWVVSWLPRDPGLEVGVGRRYKPGLKPQGVWR